MASQSWTLKAEFHGEQRRLKDWVPVGEEPTVTLVRLGVGQLFDMSPALELKLQYRDSDGEVCTLTDLTLPDALSLAVKCTPSQTSQTLRVMVEQVTTAQADCLDCTRTPLQDESAPLRASDEINGNNASIGASSCLQARAEQLGETTASLQATARQLIEDNEPRIAFVRATGGQISSEIQIKLEENREGVEIRSQQLRRDLRGRLDALAQQLGETTASLQAIGGQLMEDNKDRIASVRATGGQISSEIQNKLQEGRQGFQQGFETQSQHLHGDSRGSLEARAQQLGEATASLKAIACQLMEDNKDRIASVHATGGKISSDIQTKLQEGREGFEKGFERRSQQLRGDLHGDLSAPLLHTDA